MDFFGSLHTSSTGLAAQRLRMSLISSNLANIDTTRTADGGPYRRKDAVFAAVQSRGSFKRALDDARGGERAEVRIAGVVEDPDPFQKKYDPRHPDADESGYVLVPKINLMEEMVNMITATRSYEANVTAIKATKSMALRALEIGR